MQVKVLDNPRRCDVSEPEICRELAYVGIGGQHGERAFAMCERHVTATKEMYQMSEERAEYGVNGDEYEVYSKRAINDLHLTARMRANREGVDEPTIVYVQRDDITLRLNYREAQVIRRHLDAALSAIERTMQNQQAYIDEQTALEYGY